jgi:hypothetical protein
MGNPPRNAHDAPMGQLPDSDHLDDLLDAALAGTFPASDPTSSFVCERERPSLREGAAQDVPARGEGKKKPD